MTMFLLDRYQLDYLRKFDKNKLKKASNQTDENSRGHSDIYEN